MNTPNPRNPGNTDSTLRTERFCGSNDEYICLRDQTYQSTKAFIGQKQWSEMYVIDFSREWSCRLEGRKHPEGENAKIQKCKKRQSRCENSKMRKFKKRMGIWTIYKYVKSFQVTNLTLSDIYFIRDTRKRFLYPVFFVDFMNIFLRSQKQDHGLWEYLKITGDRSF